jgi:phosphoglycerate kinase
VSPAGLRQDPLRHPKDLPSIDSLGDLSSRRVLVRSDLNVPLDGGGITDDTRIRASLPTIARLSDAGARVIACSHLGRPKGERRADLSLRPVAGRLAELLGQRSVVRGADDVTGPSARSLVEGTGAGEVGLLENLRFDPRETSKDSAERAVLAEELAALADAYVDDAFGAVHRKHASVYDVPARLPHAAGPLLLAEITALGDLVADPARPYVVILGGAKVADKLGVIEALIEQADQVLIGGGMSYTFLAAQGHEVGRSLLDADRIDACARLLGSAKIELPVDVVVARDPGDADGGVVVPAAAMPADREGVDIGPATRRRFADALGGVRTVFWNGPLGAFETPAFAAGTRAVAEAMAAVDATTIVGGGDSAAALVQLGIDASAFTHVSTGGGASLEYLEGRLLPGLAALSTSAR